MFTIKSISPEGTYFLVKNWEKTKTFWKLGSELKITDMYNRPQDAKRALTMLLRVMSEYKDDTFYLIETNKENKIISELAL